MTDRKRLAEAGEHNWRLSEATLDPGQELRTVFGPDLGDPDAEPFPLQGFIAEPADALVLTHYQVGSHVVPWPYPVPMSRVRTRSDAVVTICHPVIVAVRNIRSERVFVRVWLCGAHDLVDRIPFDKGALLS